jgi:hypothetical protein
VNLYILAINGLIAASIVVVVLMSGVATSFRQMALLLTIAVLVPLEFGGGPDNAAVASALIICGYALVRQLLARRMVASERSPVVVATIVFMAVAVLAFVAGQYPWFPAPGAPMRAQVGGLMLFLLSGGVFLVVSHQLKSLTELRTLTWLFLVTGAVAVVTSVVGALNVSIGGIAITDAASIGSIFWIWIVTVSASQALFNAELSPGQRIALLGLTIFAIARGVFFALDWVSGWLPPLIGLGIVLLLRFPKFMFASGLVVLAPALLFGGTMYDKLAAGESYSSMTRFEAMGVMWQLIRHNPWLGFGPANYYHYTLLFPILGWWVRFNSHNNYLDLLAEVGFIGLAAFGWFVVEMYRVLLKLRARVPPGFSRAYVVGAIAGLTASLVSGVLADWIIPFTYNIGLRGFRSSLLFWFFLGGAVALKRFVAADQAVPRTLVGSTRYKARQPTFARQPHLGPAYAALRRHSS